MGAGHESSGGYALIYRSFEHRRIPDICAKLSDTRAVKRIAHDLRRPSISKDMRDFADVFSTSQEARYLADYEPNFVFDRAEVVSQIEAVEAAMAAFDGTAPEEPADILALMMVRTRGWGCSGPA